MAREIERKFLVDTDAWRARADHGVVIEQFYLAVAEDRSIRVRIVDGKVAKLTIKTGRGIDRGEFEYDIPLGDAHDLRGAALGSVIEKRRHRLAHGDLTVEIDVYSGALDGLVVAEIELPGADHPVDLPDYVGRDVTGEPGYTNGHLALNGRPDE